MTGQCPVVDARAQVRLRPSRHFSSLLLQVDVDGSFSRHQSLFTLPLFLSPEKRTARAHG